MIFCTVGTQQPFIRLINYMLDWQKTHSHGSVVYQVGDCAPSDVEIDFQKFIPEPRFSTVFNSATVIVSHAGMGNIIRAVQQGLPIVVVPRRSALQEHVNDHQVDTVEALVGLSNIFVAEDFSSFCQAMQAALEFKGGERTESQNSLISLQDAVRTFVHS
jgi:UDP-N-acetylglucosamine transferase subunit ALG13